MKKTAYDLYKCRNSNLDNCFEMYLLNQDLMKEFNVKPIYKPIIVPYFYGKVKEDEGISCLNFFEDGNGFLGFFTLHTFSQRKIAYFDSFSKVETCDAGGGFEDFLKEKLLSEEILKPSKTNKSQKFFGKQIQIEVKGNFCIEQFYDLNAKIVEKLEMTQISSPVLEKNKKSICMLSLIAESHIGLVYDLKAKILSLDIFSCKNFDEKIVIELLNSVGKVVDYKVNIRGVKHNISNNKQTKQGLKLKSTPKEDGFSLISNFDHGDCVYYLWPQRSDVWMNGGKDAQDIVSALILEMSKYDKVIIGVNNIENFCSKRFDKNKNIKVEHMPYNDAWLSDPGAYILSNEKGEHRAAKFIFNCYGGKGHCLYDPWDLDAKLSENICERHHIPYYEMPLVTEGCSACSNGNGTVIAVEECILNDNRNPNMTKRQAEEIFEKYLGAKKTIWIANGLKYDETGGHVDNVCNFVNEDTVVIAWETNKKDEQYKILHENFSRLKGQTTWDGKPIKIIKIHQPKINPISKTEAESIVENKTSKPRREGDKLTGSYINVFISDKYMIIPQFDSKYDKITIRKYRKIYPDKKILTYNTRTFNVSGGGIHCVLKKL